MSTSPESFSEGDANNSPQGSSAPEASSHATPKQSWPSQRTKGKRKPIEPRSVVWDHMTRFVNNKGERKALCNYCGKHFAADGKRNGTGSLKYHVRTCKDNPNNVETDSQQTELVLLKGGEGNICSWKFDQEACRRALARMIVKDELPFRFVESEGFKDFMALTCPRFHVPSRSTMTRDVYQLYLDERQKVKQILKNSCHRVCLTTDTWTSLQRVNYLCLTVHFIDNNWRLNKRILNFCPIDSHKGEAIGKLIESCLLGWGIDKLFTITVDNASSNDVAIGYLKRKFGQRGGCILNGKYIHVRCLAHIVNLIVGEGLKDMNNCVARIRGAVRYVRQSPLRLQRFKECAEVEKIDCKKLLCLDVSTRWNSTYLMLDSAQKFERAFERFEEQDSNFKAELESGDGWPTESDWNNARSMKDFLEFFYNVTLRISGSLYVTSNLFFDELAEIDCLLKDFESNEEVDFGVMAMRMRDKYEKYWGNVEKINMFIFIAVVLDPRHKLEYVEFAIGKMYDEEKGKAVVKKVQEALNELFEAYKPSTSSSTSSGKLSTVSDCVEGEPREKLRKRMKSMWREHKAEIDGVDHKSELERYLNETKEGESDDFELLEWWKLNSLRFPILSQIARDVLAIPVSTVASESAFSTGGRVLDSFRSSLTPKMVESLLCTQDWIKKYDQDLNKDLNNLEDELQELDILDNDQSLRAIDPTINS